MIPSPRRAALAAASCFLAACASVPSVPHQARSASPPLENAQEQVLAEDLHVRQVSEGLWLHVSTLEVAGFGSVPSNGLVVLGPEQALLVDTPWTPEQTRTLIAWIEGTLQRPVREVIVTHSHQDRTGGVAALPPRARIHALGATARLSAAQGRPFTASELPAESALELAGTRVETYFPGAGHTPDNLVVWLPEHRLLFGGCFLKEGAATGLGNVADADLASWALAVERVQARHPAPSVVIPGHGTPGGPELLAHTAALLEAATQRSSQVR